MFMTRYNPLAVSARQLNADDIFADFFGGSRRVVQAFSPELDIQESEESFIITADLPGMTDKDIEVKVHDGSLILSGRRELRAEEQDEQGFYYRERRSGGFSRQFKLGDRVDADKIDASYKDGVLTLVLPKKEQIKPRQITVSTN